MTHPLNTTHSCGCLHVLLTLLNHSHVAYGAKLVTGMQHGAATDHETSRGQTEAPQTDPPRWKQHQCADHTVSQNVRYTTGCSGQQASAITRQPSRPPTGACKATSVHQTIPMAFCFADDKGCASVSWIEIDHAGTTHTHTHRARSSAWQRYS